MDKLDFHRQFPQSGVGKTHDYVSKVLSTSTFTKVLEWGCGKGGALEHYSRLYPHAVFQGYDPYVEHYTTLPKGHWDILYSIDVLEHIEPHTTVETLLHLSSLATQCVLVIDTTPAKKTLEDGRNAHINLRTPDEWLELLPSAHNVKIDVQPDKIYGERTRLCATLG